MRRLILLSLVSILLQSCGGNKDIQASLSNYAEEHNGSSGGAFKVTSTNCLIVGDGTVNRKMVRVSSSEQNNSCDINVDVSPKETKIVEVEGARLQGQKALLGVTSLVIKVGAKQFTYNFERVGCSDALVFAVGASSLKTKTTECPNITLQEFSVMGLLGHFKEPGTGNIYLDEPTSTRTTTVHNGRSALNSNFALRKKEGSGYSCSDFTFPAVLDNSSGPDAVKANYIVRSNFVRYASVVAKSKVLSCLTNGNCQWGVWVSDPRVMPIMEVYHAARGGAVYGCNEKTPGNLDYEGESCVGFYDWDLSGSKNIVSKVVISDGDNVHPYMGAEAVDGLPIYSLKADGEHEADFIYVNQSAFSGKDLSLYRCYENGNRVCMGDPGDPIEVSAFNDYSLYYILKNNVINPLNCK